MLQHGRNENKFITILMKAVKEKEGSVDPMWSERTREGFPREMIFKPGPVCVYEYMGVDGKKHYRQKKQQGLDSRSQ